MNIAPPLAELVVRTDELQFFPTNPRKGNLEVIKQSLEANGQYRPIVVNRQTSEVLAGNHTLAAAKELGWDEIAATFVDVDQEQATRIALVDNRSNDLGSYGEQELVELLQSLPDLDGTGYDRLALERLLESVDIDFSPVSEDEQGRLDSLVQVTCPECGHEFTPSAKT